ncbi:type II secretion system protein [uncultured Desulfuromonas sp.]|uniref:type II secretion system protein n=1 Tax=uncultured Desulfuromonas sp. TaxID=181013 RepID=UPI002604D1AF|nr:type II secretion system protein [uncultured Desulfuromonas sp.]
MGSLGGVLRNRRGLTLVELIIAMAILSVLAAAVLPMAEVAGKRAKEIELRRSLRLIRTAIDEYKADFDDAVQKKKIIPALGENGYPPDLETLLQGEDFGGLYTIRRRYLRRIPRDPFDKYDEGWGLRAYADDPDSTVWGGEDVFDVFTQSDGIALDGTAYNTW